MLLIRELLSIRIPEFNESPILPVAPFPSKYIGPFTVVIETPSIKIPGDVELPVSTIPVIDMAPFCMAEIVTTDGNTPNAKSAPAFFAEPTIVISLFVVVMLVRFSSTPIGFPKPSAFPVM